MTSEIFCHKRQLLTEMIGRTGEFTLPAGTNGELSFDFGGVQWVVLCNQEWLEHRSIHKERHAGDLHVQHVVMPLFVTCLSDTEKKSCSSNPFKAHNSVRLCQQWGADLVQFPVELSRFVVLSFRRILAEEEDQPAVVHVKRVVVSVHLCGAEKERSGVKLKVAHEPINISQERTA